MNSAACSAPSVSSKQRVPLALEDRGAKGMNSVRRRFAFSQSFTSGSPGW
jgi:hypothetical protein